MCAASPHQKARLKEFSTVASRLASTDDSISHMDSRTPMEASLAAMSDSSPGLAERRRSTVQSFKQPSILNVARDKPEWISVFFPGSTPSRSRWQRPSSVSRARFLLCRGLTTRLSRGVPSAVSQLRLCGSVCKPSRRPFAVSEPTLKKRECPWQASSVKILHSCLVFVDRFQSFELLVASMSDVHKRSSCRRDLALRGVERLIRGVGLQCRCG